MVKISVLQHAPSTHLPTRPGDPKPTSRNLDPLLHPFSRARERTRALNAAKLERMFAKPFLGSLEGHIDAVECLTRRSGSLNVIASGSWDGGLVVHNIAQRSHLFKTDSAHKGKISGICFSPEQNSYRLLTCGVDRNIKLWDTRPTPDEDEGDENGAGPSEIRKPLSVFPGKSAFNSIDHHRSEPLFATASNIVQIWDETKSAPVSNLTFPTSTETISSVRFNLSEASVLASIGSDRTFTLYDIRTGKAERRAVMQMRNNALSWSPTHPTTILLASEDHNLYTFDIRSLNSPSQIYKSHVAAVMSCDWCPTGTRFVSGGWDRTVRIWKEGNGNGKSGDVYHTKRMQRVTCTLFTSDSKFVLSGSDDGNVRLWKANASEKLGIIDSRERAALEYRDALKERWKMDREVGKIVRSRHLPKPVYKAGELKRTMLESKRVKEERRRKHTRAGDSKPKAEKRKIVVAEQT